MADSCLGISSLVGKVHMSVSSAVQCLKVVLDYPFDFQPVIPRPPISHQPKQVPCTWPKADDRSLRYLIIKGTFHRAYADPLASHYMTVAIDMHKYAVCCYQSFW